MDFYKGTIPILDDAVAECRDVLRPADATFGLVPRDYAADPPAMFADPAGLETIDPSEWDARYDDQERYESSLEHLFLRGGRPAFVNLDQNGDGHCFPAGTLIRMADGTQRAIETLKLLDKVVTAEGNVGAVRQLHVRGHKDKMLTVKLHGHNFLKMTPEHPVLTERGYVKAGELTKADWVVVPRHQPARCGVVVTSSHVSGVKHRVANAPDGSAMFEERMPEPWDERVKHVPEVIELTPGVGRLLGLWLAEGCIDRSNWVLHWCFAADEEHTLVADTVRLLREEFGLDAKVVPGRPSSKMAVELQGKMWCQLFSSLCGEKAWAKRMHADLMGGSDEFLKAVFDGWMDGDGCVKTLNKAKGYAHKVGFGATVSHHLAMNMYDIATRLGMSPAISRSEGQVNEYAKQRRPVYTVKHVLSRSSYRPDFRVREFESHYLRRVREVVAEDFDGMVYNIGVEGDNSYIAEGVGVHNCWAYSTGTAIMLQRLRDNRPLVRLNPHFVAAYLRRFNGGWCGASAKVAREVGYLAEGAGPDEWPLHSNDTALLTPGRLAAAARHRVTEDWYDLALPVHGQRMTSRQLATCGFENIPAPSDFNWWGHSVCQVRWVRVERGSWGPLILNSWRGWGRHGLAVLRGGQAVADGAVAVRTSTPTGTPG